MGRLPATDAGWYQRGLTEEGPSTLWVAMRRDAWAMSEDEGKNAAEPSVSSPFPNTARRFESLS